MEDIYKVLDNLHMQWMGTWNEHYSGYHCRFLPRFGSAEEIPDHFWATKRTIMQAMRLLTCPKWIIHPWQTYARWLSTFICNGWAYRFIMLHSSWSPSLPILQWNCLRCNYTNHTVFCTFLVIGYPEDEDSRKCAMCYVVHHNQIDL